MNIYLIQFLVLVYNFQLNLKTKLRKMKSYLVNVIIISLCLLMAISAIMLGTINAKHYMSQSSLKLVQQKTGTTSEKVYADQKVWTDIKPTSVREASTDQQTPKHQVTSEEYKNKQFQLEYDTKRRSITDYKQELKENVADDIKIRDLAILSDSSNNLSNDFLSALNKDTFSDVTLKCGNVIMPLHKFVLAARSPVFEAMFSTIEYKMVFIEDLDASILSDLVSFIYGAQIKNLTLPKACDLMYAARAYQIKGLHDICTNYFKSHISLGSALQILQCADLYDKNLKADTMNYICSNFFVLKETDEWKILQSEKPTLAIEIYSMVVSTWKEKKI